MLIKVILVKTFVLVHGDGFLGIFVIDWKKGFVEDCNDENKGNSNCRFVTVQKYKAHGHILVQIRCT